MLLTLLDNLGFTGNYMECMIPAVGVYPIAANALYQIEVDHVLRVVFDKEMVKKLLVE